MEDYIKSNFFMKKEDVSMELSQLVISTFKSLQDQFLQTEAAKNPKTENGFWLFWMMSQANELWKNNELTDKEYSYLCDYIICW